MALGVIFVALGLAIFVHTTWAAIQCEKFQIYFSSRSLWLKLHVMAPCRSGAFKTIAGGLCLPSNGFAGRACSWCNHYDFRYFQKYDLLCIVMSSCVHQCISDIPLYFLQGAYLLSGTLRCIFVNKPSRCVAVLYCIIYALNKLKRIWFVIQHNIITPKRSEIIWYFLSHSGVRIWAVLGRTLCLSTIEPRPYLSVYHHWNNIWYFLSDIWELALSQESILNRLFCMLTIW